MARTIVFAALAAMVLVTACHPPAAPQPANTATPAANADAAPTPTPDTGASPAATASLAGYAGKYPFDTVNGTAFLADSRVVAGVDSAVSDPVIRKLVLDGGGPAGPIVNKGGRLLAWGCEAHNCGDHNWTIAITPDATSTQVCYHDQASTHGQSRWYLAGGKSELRPGDCPSS